MQHSELEETSKDYSRYMQVDIEKKLEPINKAVDDMHSRLEEFQTMICLAQQERVKTTLLLSSIVENNASLSELFDRIDACEKVVDHIKSHVYALEQRIENAEKELGCGGESTTSKVVANIFNPLFHKKNAERKSIAEHTEPFTASNYFH